MRRLGVEFAAKSSQRFPQTKQLFNWANKEGSFKVRVQKPIELAQIYDEKLAINKGLGIIAGEDILAKEEVFLVSTEKCITGLELVGCDRIKAYEINNAVSKIASKYYEKNLPQLYYTQNILKIICQIFAQASTESLSLHPFAKYLLESYATQIPSKNPLSWSSATLKGIYSSQLASLVSSTHSQFLSMNEDLIQNKMFGFNPQKFIELMSIVRSRNLNFLPEQPKFLDMNSVVIMAPVVDWINHSFDPNCKILGTYYQHESESFVVVKAIKDIQKGEELTLNYGNMNNLDFLMRYGFVNQVNQFNDLPISLNFDEYLDYTGQLFDFKQKVFRTQEDFTLEKFVLHQNRINKNLLRTLRIYFLRNEDLVMNPKIASQTFKDFDEPISEENERIICKFLIDVLEKELKKYESSRINTLDFKKIELPGKPGEIINLNSHQDLIHVKDQDYRNMLHICIDEQICIQKNLDYFRKHLASL